MHKHQYIRTFYALGFLHQVGCVGYELLSSKLAFTETQNFNIIVLYMNDDKDASDAEQRTLNTFTFSFVFSHSTLTYYDLFKMKRHARDSSFDVLWREQFIDEDITIFLERIYINRWTC